MKKLFLSFAIVLGMTTMGFAQIGGGLFENGEMPNREGGSNDIGLVLPSVHGAPDDQDGNDAPLGGGVALLAGLGAAYLIGKKRKD